MRSATSSWLPTRAVPAPERTRPNPAHRLGATTRSSREPPWRAAIRCWPTDSPPANWLWASEMTSSGMASSIRSVTAHASSDRSRLMTWSRMPKDRARPHSSARARMTLMRSATWSGGSPQVR